MSVHIPIPLLLIGGLLLLSLLLDVLSFFGLAWEIPSAIRAIHSKVCGYIVVGTPEDLRVAADNGLIKKGDDLLVSEVHEGDGGNVARFAIHPSVAGRPVGTELRVISIGPKRLVLDEIRHS
jgi:ribosomal protein S18 acetylase RimI-like enzyme